MRDVEYLKLVSDLFGGVPDDSLLLDGRFEQYGSEAARALIARGREVLAAEGTLEARVDYASITAGTDVWSPLPYESIYRGKERLLMQDCRDDVVELYKAWGYEPVGNEPEDQLACEIGFLLWLHEVSDARASEGNGEGADEAIEAIDSFQSEHMALWVPAYCEEAGKVVSTDLFKGLLMALGERFSN